MDAQVPELQNFLLHGSELSWGLPGPVLTCYRNVARHGKRASCGSYRPPAHFASTAYSCVRFPSALGARSVLYVLFC